MTATVDATDSNTAEQLIATVNELTTTVENLKTTIEQQANRIDELEQELAEQKDHTGREHADIRRRVTQTEEAIDSLENHATEGGSGGAAPGDEADETGSQTPLERITALPEHIADRELTANQERARFIARNIHDYAEKAPAGLVLDSRAIKRVLTASEGKRPHTQTVARVMDFLDELGKQDIHQKKRRGKKLIVVDPAAADRYGAHHDRCDRAGETSPSSNVIAEP